MPVITLTDPDTGASAKVLPELGFNCFAFQAMLGGKSVDVLDAQPDFEAGAQRPSRSGIPILFPFPNRIANATFTWEGKTYKLPPGHDQAHAIHGFCLDRPWRVIHQTSREVTGQFQLSLDAPDRLHLWPADFIIEVDYEILHNRLRMNVRLNNPGADNLPWGFGTHPWFKVPLGANSTPGDCTIEVPANRFWELENSIPTGRQFPVDEAHDLRDGAYVDVLKLDDVLTDLDVQGPQFECVLIDERAGWQVTQTCPPIFREIVVFTPPNRSAICVEPYTCPTNAIHLTAKGQNVGWRTLAPGTEFHTWIDISAGPVLA